MNKISCSIGVCVYNEEKNIERLLDSVLNQKLSSVTIKEILVIASGSTDSTRKIVKKYSKKDKRIRLIQQIKREGKASAVNLFIGEAKSDILVLLGGDLILTNTTIQALCEGFTETETGMTGAHPVPVNYKEQDFSSFAGNLLWELHHKVSLKKPKMGEVIAFKKIFKRIPITGADEASIEPLIRGQGFNIKYVPTAIIYNKAPTSISEFIKQRRRNYWLHLVIKYEQSYVVTTLPPFTIFKALFEYVRENPKPIYLIFIPPVILLEAYSRYLGWFDYRIIKKNHAVWETVESTKNL